MVPRSVSSPERGVGGQLMRSRQASRKWVLALVLREHVRDPHWHFDPVSPREVMTSLRPARSRADVYAIPALGEDEMLPTLVVSAVEDAITQAAQNARAPGREGGVKG